MEYTTSPRSMAVEAVDKLVDEEPVLIFQPRQHAGAFHAHRCKENNDEDGNDDGNEYVAQPELKAPALRGDAGDGPEVWGSALSHAQ